MATQLSRTFSSQGNQRKFTISVWIKRTSLSQQSIFGSGGGNNYATRMYFDGSSNIQWWNYFNGSYAGRKYSSRSLRDTNGYYHCVFRCDTANSTASERMRMYVNGEEVTDLETSDNPSQNQTMEVGHTGAHYIGGYGTGAEGDCIMSHFHYCDGYSYAPTEFGETDSTTGEWKIKTSPSVSYGTTGFFILKNGNSVTDQSGLGNNWTVANGTLTKTEDNPSNVFATLSPHILPRNSGESISNGSLSFGTSSAIWNTESSAFGIANGKYYFEVKLKDNGSDRRFRWGLQKEDVIITTGENKVLCGTGNPCIGYRTGGESATQGGYLINFTDTALSDGDINENNAIYGFAIDLDNQRMYGHYNGTWLHSGNPSAGTGGIDVSSFYTVGEPLFPSFTVHNSTIELNFGNGYFGTTAVATNSGNGYQDADGNGIFNYTVPTNYRALCTKGLNQ